VRSDGPWSSYRAETSHRQVENSQGKWSNTPRPPTQIFRMAKEGEEDEMSDAFAPPRKSTMTLLSSSLVLSGEVESGMDDTHMPRQGIVAREGLFLSAYCTADLLLASVVDGVFVSGKVVWPREDGIT